MDVALESGVVLSEQDRKKIKNGKFYVLAFIILHFLVHICTKILLILVEKYHLYELIGTAITVATLYYLWRGSKFAFGFIIFGFTLAIFYTIYILYQGSIYLGVGFSTYIAIVGVLLLNPASRLFLEHQALKNT